MKGYGLCPLRGKECNNGKPLGDNPIPSGVSGPPCAWWDEYANDCSITIIVRELRNRNQQ